ncbi:MAG: sigma-70 family RNA polymerase sigma factor [Cyanobacteriota bacterium]|nr:sigma-70 family RNA polymerase sigma factor [Cyanobacteriota bacterium]
MLVKKRRDLVDKFSSFICFTTNNHQIQLSWKVDVGLESNMKSKVEADSEAKESFWAQYFLKMLLNQDRPENSECNFSIAKKHFSAYLQEACFKAARDIQYEFKYIKHKYSLEEFFQIANIAANSPTQYFKSFNFERGKINIEAYAITAFKRFIRNQIYRQDLEARRTRFSSYGLLKDLSAGELNDALLAQNFYAQQIISHRLAWQCFCEVFHITSNNFGRSRNITANQLREIADYYNQRCSQLNIPNLPATNVVIQEMLLTCIDAAKNYRNKQYLYFEEDYYTVSDPAPSSWDVLIQQEESQQLEVILHKLFINMPEQCQIMFKLWQGLNLTQTEIVHLVKSKYSGLQKQYQVARHLKKYSREILKNFALEWNKTNPDIHINNEKDIERIKSAFDRYLHIYCQRLIFSVLDKILQEFSDEEQKHILMIQLETNYIDNVNELPKIIIKLLEIFKQYMERSMCLEKGSLSMANNKLADVVNEWIHIKRG